ncbi:uncharacterized protein A1O5_01971 [Cladophialophora psammophila CBS 110553]|uniref:D-xylulose reductase n=1 Tax=Cladophialophora psammophila CBS 110553 TaxID=1182543 RepID=W9XD48_9EURO|nr:uncharacterized protein A1O5_01971 [Cladophialophora psammophila CBS 110553]EXJ75275.1 hypothetical protein A1O5_01971 [Cladophialophora psammophila CBS 110553]
MAPSATSNGKAVAVKADVSKNRAVILSKINDVSVQDWPLKLDSYRDSPPYEPGSPLPSGKALVRVRAGGICGSDIHFWKEGRAGPDIIKEPFIIGHEAAGEVIQVADDVQSWVPGDRAAIKPALPCLACDDCTTGYSNLCSSIEYYGVPAPGGRQDGLLTTYKIVPVTALARLTPRISWVEAGAIQPLAIALQMTRQAGLKAHQTVLILGGGCIGLLLGAVAKAYAARKVVVFEVQPHRAEFAKTYCADQAFVNPPRHLNETTEEYSNRVAKHILSSVDGLYRGFDVVVEAAGAEECMQIGLHVCKPGGTYVQVGLLNSPMPRIPIMDICSKQLNVRGTWRYTTNCFEDAISLIDRGLVDMKSLISHVFPFEQSLEAFETVHEVKAKDGRNVFKVVISDEKL